MEAIQTFRVNMTFISSNEVKIVYFMRWNKSHYYSKDLNFLFIIHKINEEKKQI